MTKKITPSQDFVNMTECVCRLQDKEFKYAIFEVVNKFLLKANENILFNALEDKKITEDKITELITKYKVTRMDVGEALKHLYDNGIEVDSGIDKKKVIMVTMKGSGIYKLKNWLKKNYNVEVMLPDEMMNQITKIEQEKANYIG